MKIRIISLFSLIFFLLSMSAFAALDLKFNNTINMAPASPSEGAVVTFSVMFMPEGAAVDNLKCTWGVDGTVIGQKTFGHLNANASTGLSFDWTATSGNHTAWFELDPDHLLGDSNYANNRTEISFTIGGGTPTGKPDLTLSVSQTPFKLEEGKPTILNITVKNIGTADSVACKGIMKEDGVETESKTIPPIAAGGEWKATVLRTVKCNSKYEIIVDTENTNNESNEGNNSLTKTMKCGLTISNPGIKNNIKVINGPDLKPTISMWVNQNPSLSDNQEHLMQFSVIVTNLGNTNSKPCLMIIKKNNKIIETRQLGLIPYAGHATDYQSVNCTAVLKCKDKLTVIVDSDNQNAETNENNNTASKTFLCL